MEILLANGTSRRADGGRRNSSCSDASAATITDDKLEVGIHVDIETSKSSQLYLKRRMEKVPMIMRNDEKAKGYFDPKMVSVGPYHHGKEELQMVEKIKPIIVQLFISSSGRDIAEFRQKVLEVVDDVRSCYIEGSTDNYSDEEFAEMMLLDGLFVSAFIESIPQTYEGPRMDRKDFNKHLGEHAVFYMYGDIFLLLENQIPFQVLELLLSLKSGRPNELITLLDGFSGRTPKEPSESRLQPIHCLEHFWLKANEFTRSKGVKLPSFRSISQLKAKGIHARRGGPFPSRAFRFKSFFFFAILEIPQLIMDPRFIINLSNHIAYECTPNNPNNLPAMAFTIFMKSLIDSAEDVKELRSKNILFSTYSTDEDVVKMFSSIPTFGGGNINVYGDVREMIQKHYNSKAKTWLAELIHNYFNSPWTFIAFVATIAVVILSFLQTYFTIFPRSGK